MVRLNLLRDETITVPLMLQSEVWMETLVTRETQLSLRLLSKVSRFNAGAHPILTNFGMV